MGLPTSAEETYYSSLTPEALLQRLANRTAIATTSYDGLSSSYRSQPFHEFEGTISNHYFAIRRLPADSSGAHSYQLTSPAPPPEVEGWLTEHSTGGTQVQLRYQAIQIKWKWALLSMLLLVWSRGAFVFAWPTATQAGQAVAAAVLMLLASWAARPISLWLRMRELRPRLVELLSLATNLTT
jgi:hypothetical protein